MYVKAIKRVAEIFSAKKAAMLELTIPIMRGLISEAPKYITPITVVMQSIEPSRIIRKLGNTSAFNVYIEAFSFSLLLLSAQNFIFNYYLRIKLLNSIYFEFKNSKSSLQRAITDY
jgi:hypothetical protein